ncbi:MAG: hypothetical protein OEZ58_21200 [Gammaproteobacteria bacterium]|nr:hypothetical protein [Gammaproteobacteria bacterium]
MVDLTNIENDVTLKCSIEGYQFDQKDEPDDDWCNVKVELRQGNRKFEKTDPALEASDLIRIKGWFECLARNELPSFAVLSFTEPCIEFAFLSKVDNRIRISVNLSHELRPDFDLTQFRTKFDDWNIVFDLDGTDFERNIASLSRAIELFPIRS